MLNVLDQQTTLTTNQKKIISAAILGDMLEFFDFFLIAYVLAFIVGPWQLTFGQSAIILLASGVGAIVGGFFWGWLADRIGRRPVFMATILTFSIATGVLALTPDGAWIFLASVRFVIGFGVGGLYCVDLPLVQEFMPAKRRGFIGGLVTVFVPVGVLLGALCGAYLVPLIGWRGVFAVGMLPALLTLLVRAWVPESPRWLLRQGRVDDARASLAWALQMDAKDIVIPSQPRAAAEHGGFAALFRHPRSLAVSWLGNLGAQTGAYGIDLWAPTLLVLLLKIAPAQAAYLMIFAGIGGLCGRLAFSFLSEAIGRRPSATIACFGAAIAILLAGYLNSVFLGTVSVFWLLIIVIRLFGEGGFAVFGPYASEVWPAQLRTTGMGSAYGFGGIGKIIGPAGLALIVGSSNVIKPDASIENIVPAFWYLACWFIMAGFVYLLVGFETKGRSFESIDEELESDVGVPVAKAATPLL